MPNTQTLSYSTLYLPNHPPFTTETLRQAERPEAIISYAALPASLQSAVRFAWQWEHGNELFTVATSGSTGPPKTIEVHRQQILVSVGLTQQALHLASHHTALLCLNANTIGGTMMIARALHLGMDMEWVAPTANPWSVATRSPDFVALVPLQMQTVLTETPERLANLHAILVGGAPVGLALEEAIRTQVTSPVYSTYGMTETLSHVALRRLNGLEAGPNYRVLGDTHIDTDERGCLTIRGEITQQRRIVTNDLVDIADARHFRWRGRYDWIINSGGVKVSPERVELAVEQGLANAGSVPRFFVTGFPDERLGQRVVLIVEAEVASEEAQQQLLRTIAEALPPYHAPKEIRYAQAFRETKSGKVDRHATVQAILLGG